MKRRDFIALVGGRNSLANNSERTRYMRRHGQCQRRHRLNVGLLVGSDIVDAQVNGCICQRVQRVGSL